MEVVAGLDIGCSHVVAAVVPSDTGGSVADPLSRGVAIGCSDTLGYRRGSIGDLGSLAQSVREAINSAEAAGGEKINTVCIGLSGHTLEFNRIKCSNLIGRGRVNEDDLKRLKRLAQVSGLPAGRQIIQVIPIEYTADGMPVSGDPLGVQCSRLGMECLIITAAGELIDSLIDVVQGTGVRVWDFFPSTLAASGVLLNKAQRQLGTALVDLGGSCTCVLVYNHGHPVAFEVLPVGSDHVTSDLAICLRTSIEAAEAIKLKAVLESKAEQDSPEEPGDPGGLAGKAATGHGEVIEVPRLSGAGFNKFPRKAVMDIIEARISEIVEMTGASITRLTGDSDLPGGLVLAGGGSMLGGLNTFVSKHLGIAVQNGVPEITEKNNGFTVNMAGAVGLLRYHHSVLSCTEAAGNRPAPNLFRKVRGFFRL